MTDGLLRALVGALALGAASVAAYLTVVHFDASALVCPTSGCETVQRSRYAELAGVPVALLGLLAYLAIAASTLRRGMVSAAAGAAVAVTSLAFGGYLLVVQLVVIDAVCAWCVAVDVLASMLAVAAVTRLAYTAE